MTTALLSLFAACTNDDFISNGQGTQSGDAAMRPTVDVTLNVLGDGADTRFDFDKETGYQWEAGDKIGALLMDEVRGFKGPDKDNAEPQRPFENLEEWAQKPWTERYRLVDYVGTDYPFERQEDGTWTTNSKMLEGNYFFTAPFADYMGNREAVHSIGEQKQDGRDWEGAYADNQFFIGYSRIMAGTQGGDVMSANLEMTPVLGAIGLTIENQANIATTFTVEKVVLECDDFSTLIKINPVAAKYTGEDENLPVEGPRYNIDVNEVEWWSDPKGDEKKLGYFNYANYEEVKKGEGVDDKWKETIWVADEFNEEYVSGVYVNNTGRSTNYKRQNALRAVVNNVEESGHRAALTVENSPELKVGESIQLVVMTNIYKAEIEEIEGKENVTNPIKAWIYTNKGLVGPIDLNNKQVEGSGVSFGSSKGLDEVRPGYKSSVKLILDVTAIERGAAQLDVYTSEDLEQLIDWNLNAETVYKANLKANVTLTPEMSAKLMESTSNLYVETIEGNNEYTLTLAEGVDKKILNKVLVDGDIKVENALELDSRSFVDGIYKTEYGADWNTATTFKINNTINIAEKGSVKIVGEIANIGTGDWQTSGVDFGYNKGTLTIDKNVTKFSIEENKGIMNVNAQVKLDETSYNVAGGYVTIAEGADLGGNKINKFVNEGEKHGNLLGDLRYDEENVEAAIIDNYGRITGLENEEFGKLIVRAEAGQMTLTKNNGIVDITENIKADVTKTFGNIVYAVTKENTAKEIAEALITDLQIDGGKVVAEENASLDKVEKLHSTAKGGAIGSDDVTIAFPKAAEVWFNGNLTLKNVDLSGTKDDILIKSGNTWIEGTVNLIKTKNNATGDKATLDETGTRRFVLASYDWLKYKPVPAELHIAPEAILTAKSISISDEAAEHHNGSSLVDQTIAVVDNDGTVKLVYAVASMGKVNWSGDDAESYQYPKPTADETVAFESDFATLMDKYANPEDIKVIEINSDVNFSDEDNNNSKVIAFLKDKEIVLKEGGKLLNVSGNLGLAIKKLTVAGNNSSVGSGTSASKALMLTVDEIELKDNATLTIWHSSIMLTKVQTMGKGYAPEGITKGTDATISEGSGSNGQINAKDAQGNLLTLNLDDFVWE